MSLAREQNLDEIALWVRRLQLQIEANKSLRHQNSSIELESFFRDMLNLVFDMNLSNVNTLFCVNHDSFDLADNISRVAVQVTTTTESQKIHETLNKFLGKHETTYSRLVFMYPIMSVPNTRGNYADKLNGFDFDAKRDRWNLETILQRAQDMTIDEQATFLTFLRRELRPLEPASEQKLIEPVKLLRLHSLRPAKSWQPRDEYNTLIEMYRSNHPSILALVGIGGAGKTAMLARLVKQIEDENHKSDNVHRVLAYSFQGGSPEYFRCALSHL